MSIIEKAEFFARGAHAGQKHGDRPYWTHLRDVAERVRMWDGGDDIVCAAWLHDTIEDTPVTYQHILENFGYVIAEIVWMVTDEMGRNRAERKERTYPKIFSSPESTIVKVADLWDNATKSIRDKSKHLDMYIGEWREIIGAFFEGVKSQAPFLVPILKELDFRMKEVQ